MPTMITDFAAIGILSVIGTVWFIITALIGLFISLIMIVVYLVVATVFILLVIKLLTLLLPKYF